MDNTIIYESASFSIYKNKVIQGDNVAVVVSPTHLKSNYQSPTSTSFSRLIEFKFSINEKDNELPTGANHWLIIGENDHQSSFVKFGEHPKSIPDNPGTFLPTNYEYTFMVDMSSVLKQFENI